MLFLEEKYTGSATEGVLGIEEFSEDFIESSKQVTTLLQETVLMHLLTEEEKQGILSKIWQKVKQYVTAVWKMANRFLSRLKNISADIFNKLSDTKGMSLFYRLADLSFIMLNIVELLRDAILSTDEEKAVKLLIEAKDKKAYYDNIVATHNAEITYERKAYVRNDIVRLMEKMSKCMDNINNIVNDKNITSKINDNILVGHAKEAADYISMVTPSYFKLVNDTFASLVSRGLTLNTNGFDDVERTFKDVLQK